jgi:hypothetical protein
MTQTWLVSWNEGAAKRAILDFVERVTHDGPDFVEPSQRIATFDNDGTLWCEKPTFVQADFLLRRVRELTGGSTDAACTVRTRTLTE